MPPPDRRKNILIFALMLSLLASLGAIIAQAELRQVFSSQYFILCLSVIGCILLLLSGYVWDRTLRQRLRTLQESTRTPFGRETAAAAEEEAGDPDEIIGLARQIERMARSLQTVEANYRGIVEDQLDLICRYRPDGRLTFVNGAYGRFFGKTRPELLNQRFPLYELGLPPRQTDGTLPAMAAFEYALTAADGQRTWHHWTNRAITGRDEEIIEYQAVGHDITLRREAEAALRRAKEAAESADRAKTEFLAVVSHEIRTPINGISGFARLLRETPLTAEQRDCVDMIGASSRTLEALINDILDLSKIEAGKAELKHAPFALAACLQEVCAFFQPKARETGLALVCALSSQVPAIVIGDEPRLRQVLTNLIDNALKFTESGEVRLTLDAEKGEPVPGGALRSIRLNFAVRDTGIGIPRADLDKLFLPFSQLDTSTTRRRGGTGLGLVISKKLCELMHGAISVDSQPGQGSTFYFSIRAEYEKEDSANPLGAPVAGAGKLSPA